MKIRLEFFSILAQWLGAANAAVDLPTGANYNDLLEYIGTTYGERMPGQLWCREKCDFAEQVGAFRNGVRIDRRTAMLKNGDVVRFMIMMGGG